MHSINIPEDRVPVLVGKKGGTKRRIQDLTGTKITVEGPAVVIEGDPLGELKALDMVHAIGRGFSPKKALTLNEEEMVFELIPITDYAHTTNSITRLKGRLIGEKGRARRNLERLTRTRISVYGKTVGLIGKIDDVEEAKQAVVMLLSGSKHQTVYNMLYQD